MRPLKHCAVWGAEYRARKLEFWQDVYGVNMRAMKESVVSTAHLGTVKADKVVTSASTLLHLNLAEMTLQQTEFTVPFQLTALQDCTVSMLVAYFDVDFAAGAAPASLAQHPVASNLCCGSVWGTSPAPLDQMWSWTRCGPMR